MSDPNERKFMTLFRRFVFLAGVLIVSLLTACGGDDIKNDDIYFGYSVPLANPPGGEITTDTIITVTFNYAPVDVRVSVGTVTVAGKTATITGPFPLGPLVLTITWADGRQDFTYTVTKSEETQQLEEHRAILAVIVKKATDKVPHNEKEYIGRTLLIQGFVEVNKRHKIITVWVEDLEMSVYVNYTLNQEELVNNTLEEGKRYTLKVQIEEITNQYITCKLIDI